MREMREAFELMDALSLAVHDNFGDSINLFSESDDLAMWLIREGWVKGAPNEITD